MPEWVVCTSGLCLRTMVQTTGIGTILPGDAPSATALTEERASDRQVGFCVNHMELMVSAPTKQETTSNHKS